MCKFLLLMRGKENTEPSDDFESLAKKTLSIPEKEYFDDPFINHDEDSKEIDQNIE